MEHLLSDSWNTPRLWVFHLTCGPQFQQKTLIYLSFHPVSSGAANRVARHVE